MMYRLLAFLFCLALPTVGVAQNYGNVMPQSVIGNVDPTTHKPAVPTNSPYLKELHVNGLLVGSGPGYHPSNTFVGMNAGAAAPGDGGHTAVGYQALQSVNGGCCNTAVGWQALWKTTTGMNNVAVGKNALEMNVTGMENVAIGDGALANATNSGTTAVGQGAMQNTTSGANNVAVGWGALYLNTTGNYNTAIGYYANYSNVVAENNVALGNNALANATSGDNTAIGMKALHELTTGGDNTAVGEFAMSNVGGAGGLTTGSGNTAIGRNAGSGLTTQNNVTILGRCSGAGAADNTAYVCNGAGDSLAVFRGGFLQLPNTSTIHLDGAFTPTTYALYGDSTYTILNVATGGIIGFRIGDQPAMSLVGTGLTIAGTLNVTYMQTFGGTGGQYVCIDTAGVMYKKAVCP